MYGFLRDCPSNFGPRRALTRARANSPKILSAGAAAFAASCQHWSFGECRNNLQVAYVVLARLLHPKPFINREGQVVARVLESEHQLHVPWVQFRCPDEPNQSFRRL